MLMTTHCPHCDSVQPHAVRSDSAGEVRWCQNCFHVHTMPPQTSTTETRATDGARPTQCMSRMRAIAANVMRPHTWAGIRYDAPLNRSAVV